MQTLSMGRGWGDNAGSQSPAKTGKDYRQYTQSTKILASAKIVVRYLMIPRQHV